MDIKKVVKDYGVLILVVAVFLFLFFLDVDIFGKRGIYVKKAVEQERERIKQEYDAETSRLEKMLAEKMQTIVRLEKSYKTLQTNISLKEKERQAIRSPESYEEIKRRFHNLGYPVL